MTFPWNPLCLLKFTVKFQEQARITFHHMLSLCISQILNFDIYLNSTRRKQDNQQLTLKDGQSWPGYPILAFLLTPSLQSDKIQRDSHGSGLASCPSQPNDTRPATSLTVNDGGVDHDASQVWIGYRFVQDKPPNTGKAAEMWPLQHSCSWELGAPKACGRLFCQGRALNRWSSDHRVLVHRATHCPTTNCILTI